MICNWKEWGVSVLSGLAPIGEEFDGRAGQKILRKLLTYLIFLKKMSQLEFCATTPTPI